MAGYRNTPGNRGAWMLRRDDGDRSEIVTFSLWESREHIKAFAGDDVEQAVFYPEDDRFLVEATSRCATTTSSRSAPSTAPTRRSMRSRCRVRDSP
jgi:heme-degrading monooxygenase HmoA